MAKSPLLWFVVLISAFVMTVKINSYLNAGFKVNLKSKASERPYPFLKKKPTTIIKARTGRATTRQTDREPIHPCNYKSIAKVVELVDEDDGSVTAQPLLEIPEINIESKIVDINGTHIYEAPFIMPIKRENGATDQIDVELVDPQQRAGYANVKLEMSPRVAKRFEIVGQFCNSAIDKDILSPLGCPQNLDSSDTIKGFELLCDSNIVYGWQVKRKPYSLPGTISIEKPMLDFPRIFGAHFKTELCDQDDVVGGNCTFFRGQMGVAGSIYGAIAYTGTIFPTPESYELLVNFNKRQFIDNFVVNNGADTRSQTISLNSFAFDQTIGLPPKYVVDYNGCSLFARGTSALSGHEVPYRCQLQVDELDGFANPIDIRARVD